MKKLALSLVSILFFSITACSQISINEIISSTTTDDPSQATTSSNPSNSAGTETIDYQQFTDRYGDLVMKTDGFLFFQDYEYPGDITVTNDDGSNPVNLTDSIAGYKFFISNSPDASWVLFYVTKTPERIYAGNTKTTTPADYYLVSTTEHKPIFVFQGSVLSGNDPTTWNEEGTDYLVNCPLGESLTGLCHIHIENGEATWENLNIEALNITKVAGDFAVFVSDQNKCLYRIDISTLATQNVACTDDGYYFQQIIPVNENTVIVSTAFVNQIKSQIMEINISTQTSEIISEFEGNINYPIYSNRDATIFAGCLNPGEDVQSTLFLYDINLKHFYRFNDTEIIDLRHDNHKTFKCDRLYFLWNKDNELALYGELQSSSNSWGPLSESEVKCYRLDLDNEKVLSVEPCIYNESDYYW